MNIVYSRYGRLGNNIQQLRNAIFIGILENYNVVIPPNNCFNSTYVIINKNITRSDKNIRYRHNCWKIGTADNYAIKMRECIDRNDWNENAPDGSKVKDLDIINKVIRSKLIGLCNIIPNKIIKSNDLLIHIRSGDIFKNNPHGGYTPPPLSYYIHIIDTNTYNNIYLIAENKANPCIQRLLDLYPNIKFTEQSLTLDLELVLGAQNIVSSVGSFIPSILQLSPRSHNVYSPAYDNQNINKYNIKLGKYKTLMSPWKNTPTQRNILLTHRLESESE